MKPFCRFLLVILAVSGYVADGLRIKRNEDGPNAGAQEPAAGDTPADKPAAAAGGAASAFKCKQCTDETSCKSAAATECGATKARRKRAFDTTPFLDPEKLNGAAATHCVAIKKKGGEVQFSGCYTDADCKPNQNSTEVECKTCKSSGCEPFSQAATVETTPTPTPTLTPIQASTADPRGNGPNEPENPADEPNAGGGDNKNAGDERNVSTIATETSAALKRHSASMYTYIVSTLLFASGWIFALD